MRDRTQRSHRSETAQAAINDEYEVGYGRPPAATRFRPGQSGNPKGRPKKPATVLGALEAELGRTQRVRENGKEKVLTQAQIIAKQLCRQAMEGKSQAVAQLLKLEPRLLAGAMAAEAGSRAAGESEASDAPLSPAELDMMRWYLETQAEHCSAVGSPGGATDEQSCGERDEAEDPGRDGNEDKGDGEDMDGSRLAAHAAEAAVEKDQ